MIDLFGVDRTPPRSRPVEQPVELDLFDAAAERIAIASGRPKSQEHAELVGGRPKPIELR
jgi:hypothetical protein